MMYKAHKIYISIGILSLFSSRLYTMDKVDQIDKESLRKTPEWHYAKEALKIVHCNKQESQKEKRQCLKTSLKDIKDNNFLDDSLKYFLMKDAGRGLSEGLDDYYKDRQQECDKFTGEINKLKCLLELKKELAEDKDIFGSNSH